MTVRVFPVERLPQRWVWRVKVVHHSAEGWYRDEWDVLVSAGPLIWCVSLTRWWVVAEMAGRGGVE